MNELRPLEVPETAPLFPALHSALLRLLRALGPDDWERPTVAGAWRIRDVAMHLLDGDLRTLSAHRDGHRLATDGPVESYADVLALIHGLNASGVAFGRRMSPALLVDLLEVSGRWMSAFVAGLDPDAPALFPVAWAGETASSNRLDTAREYTERWHHQMQMRAALDAEAASGTAGDELLADRFLVPLLDTAVRALPHAYRAVAAPEGTTIVIAASDSEWTRTLRRGPERWTLHAGSEDAAAAQARAPANGLWRLFFNALPGGEARASFRMSGNAALLEPLWTARSVMV